MTSSNPSSFVIDSGVGYALCVQDGTSITLRSELEQLTGFNVRLFAPRIWRFELTSILTKAVHFQQMSEYSARQVLELIGELRVQLIQPDDELVMQASEWTLQLKRAAAYDSFYLALARRLGCELWTMDRKLANAVSASWVRYVGKAK
jgi:predicted nucleic acid-binding protein